MITTHELRDGKMSIETQVCGSGEPLLFIHGAMGLTIDPFLEDLGRKFKVVAPHIPGYGASTGPEHIDDVFDVVLFLHELMDSLGIQSAHVLGHSMGGMLAAELAAFDNSRVKKLVLASPAGFWLDAHPIPDFFAAQLDEVGPLLFHDLNSPAAKMMTTIPDDFKALEAMYVERVKRLATASKFLWPIPDRGLRKRAYRINAPTLVVWGESDRLIPPVYAKEFLSEIKGSRVHMIKEAGHMMMYEQQAAFVKAVTDFLS
jgi:pimeloyl-ACP methyl ester carboxylesterase